MPGKKIKSQKSKVKNIKRKLFTIYYLLFTILSSLIFVLPVKSAISSCNANLDTSLEYIESSPAIHFTIDNTSSSNIVWVKISAPSSDFLILDGVADGWSTSIESSTNIVFTNGSLSPESSKVFEVVIITPSNAMEASSWIVLTSDSPSGDDPFSCTGDLSMTISSDVPDRIPPRIFDFAISDVTSSSVKISWLTSEPSTTEVDYGTKDTYGQNKKDLTYVISHTIDLTELLANTTYHYSAKSKDAAANESETGDWTFVTSKSPTTITTTVTTIKTKTDIKFITPTPTPTPPPDKTPPSVVVDTDLSLPFEKAPKISGRATDDRSAITKIEYSIDNGKSWIVIFTLEAAAETKSLSVPFEFTQEGLEDGNYKVRVRATDISSNVGESFAYTLIVDRLPPQVGASVHFIGPQILFPNREGLIVALSGLDQNMSLSAVGGPITIDLFAEKIGEKKEIKGKSQGQGMYSFVYNQDNGLWSGALSFSEHGLYQLRFRALDGASNRTEGKLNTVAVLEEGKVVDSAGAPIEDATLTVHYLVPEYNMWFKWDGNAFGQNNPQRTDREGKYRLFLPKGTYYIKIDHSRFSPLATTIFSVEKPTPINTQFVLTPAKTIRIGFLNFPLPYIFSDPFSVHISLPSKSYLSSSGLLSKEAPPFTLPTTLESQFSLYSMRGRSSLVTFVNLWAPQALEQIAVANKLVKTNSSFQLAMVLEQESMGKAVLFQRRGGYTIPLIVDSDGILIEDYEIHSLPTHYFLDRKGMARNIVVGVLNEQEIKEMLLSY